MTTQPERSSSISKTCRIINDPTTRNYIKEDFGKTTREYMLLSPGGCMSERREGYIIEDADFNRLGLGQCYVKNADGITYLFQID